MSLQAEAFYVKENYLEAHHAHSTTLPAPTQDPQHPASSLPTALRDL